MIVGAIEDHGSLLYLSKDGLLYCREQRWDKKDVMQIYDIANNGETIQTLKLNQLIESCRLLKDDRYVRAVCVRLN